MDKSPVNPTAELYEIEIEGVEVFNARLINGGRPWDSFPSPGFTMLDDWTLYIGDTIFVCITGREDGLAKVWEIKELNDGRWLLVLFWYYTRGEVEEELKVGGRIPRNHHDHLNYFWLSNALYTHILSTNHMITM